MCLLIVPCGSCNRPVEQPRVWNVSPRDLHSAFVVGDDERWSGQVVRVRLVRGSYTTSGTSVVWRGGRDTDAPDLVFVCDSLSPPTGGTVFVRGVVKGRVRDGLHRGTGADWYVRVEGCVVTPPSP